MSKTVQDKIIEIEPISKTQTERIMKMKNIGMWTRISETNFNNRRHDMEVRISDIEDAIKEMNTSFKENAKSKKLTQNIQEIWDTTER